MHDAKKPPPESPPVPEGAERSERPIYERPRLTRKKSVQRATLFTGTGPSATPLVPTG